MGFAAFMAGGVRRVLGVAAAMLPARWWPWLDVYVPATTSAVIAGILTLLSAAAIGLPGFLAYVAAVASAANETAWAAAQRNPDVENVGALLRGAPAAFTALALPLFLFTTPAGWLTMYLAVTGLVRAIAPVLDDGLGDPILTGIDTILARTRRGTRRRLEHMQREELEGPAMPDRIMSAQTLGVAGDFVIVSSRRKPDWEKGTVVMTPDATAYRIGAVEDRTIAGRLRTLYPLTLHADLEAFRRVVHYELPPGRH